MAISATSVFVGRQAELRVLNDAFAEASAGHSQLLLVEGEAGIGKTTLVERFVSELQTARVLRASGDESECHVPFAMADQVLRYNGRGSDALGARRHVAA
ncbi:MAG: ATP-binding protein [Solirubrobacteraceae bacterium]